MKKKPYTETALFKRRKKEYLKEVDKDQRRIKREMKKEERPRQMSFQKTVVVNIMTAHFTWTSSF